MPNRNTRKVRNGLCHPLFPRCWHSCPMSMIIISVFPCNALVRKSTGRPHVLVTRLLYPAYCPRSFHLPGRGDTLSISSTYISITLYLTCALHTAQRWRHPPTAVVHWKRQTKIPVFVSLCTFLSQTTVTLSHKCSGASRGINTHQHTHCVRVFRCTGLCQCDLWV